MGEYEAAKQALRAAATSGSGSLERVDDDPKPPAPDLELTSMQSALICRVLGDRADRQ